MGHKAAFREGISLRDIMDVFPDDETARKRFEDAKWPGGSVRCPDCTSINIQSGAKHPTMTHRCRDCKKFFSMKTGTVMQSSKLGYRIWVIAIYLLTTNRKGVSSMKLHRELGVTPKSAWHLAHKLRKSWESGRIELEGPVVEIRLSDYQPSKTELEEEVYLPTKPENLLKTVVCYVKVIHQQNIKEKI